MRKIIFICLFLLFTFNAYAIEIYNKEDSKVDIYGDLRGYIGYGFSFQGRYKEQTSGVINDEYSIDYSLAHMMSYGISDMSNVGVNIKIGQFKSKIEIGANEQTLFSRTADTNTIGLRYIYASWDFLNGGQILFGKTDTPTSMIDFSSDIFNNDCGLYGSGGSSTYHKRFQIQYSFKGLTLALIEEDRRADSADFVTFFLDDVYTPRAAISYVYENDSLLAKIAATYTAYNGYYTDNYADTKWATLHAFGIVAGVKPYFNQKNMWLSIQARYGMNEDIYGETTHSFLYYGTENTNIAFLPSINEETNTFYNIHRIGATIEYGVKLHNKFTLITGLGFQTDLLSAGIPDETMFASSYALFIQGQYSITNNFMLVPQIGYYGNFIYGEGKYSSYTLKMIEDNNAIMAGLQFRIIF